MPSYVKAYTVRDLNQYPSWMTSAGAALSDDTVVFINEALVVATSAFNQHEVIFADRTPAWADFCRTVLRFAVPDWDAEAAAVRAAMAAGPRSTPE
jgi:hypothetical protein